MTLIKLTDAHADTECLIDIRNIRSVSDSGEFRNIYLNTLSLNGVISVKETIEEIENKQHDIRSLRCFHFSFFGA